MPSRNVLLREKLFSGGDDKFRRAGQVDRDRNTELAGFSHDLYNFFGLNNIEHPGDIAEMQLGAWRFTRRLGRERRPGRKSVRTRSRGNCDISPLLLSVRYQSRLCNFLTYINNTRVTLTNRALRCLHSRKKNLLFLDLTRRLIFPKRFHPCIRNIYTQRYNHRSSTGTKKS